MQHKLSATFEEARHKQRIAAASAASAAPRELARLLALTAKHTGVWLYTSCLGSNLRLWLPPLNFRVAVKLRLGLPLGPAQPCSHVKCGRMSDEFGDHSVSCLCDGNKTRIHTAVLDILMQQATAAGFQPQREPHALPGDPNLRLDAGFTMPGVRNHVQLIDVAVTNALAAYNIKPGKIGPSAAATAYETVKNGTYLTAIKTQRPDATFVPMIFDSFGGVGATGVELLYVLCQKRALYARVPLSVATTMLFHKLVFTIVSWVTRLCLTNVKCDTLSVAAMGSAGSLRG